LIAYLHEHDAGCQIAITEAGPDEGNFIGVEPFVEWCRIYDAELMRDPDVIGCALWTLGGGGWGAVNWQDALWNPKKSYSPLGDYIATVEPSVPPIEPPMPHVLEVRPINVSLQVEVDATLQRDQVHIIHANNVEVRLIDEQSGT
jgi:hypothetical protein